MRTCTACATIGTDPATHPCPRAAASLFPGPYKGIPCSEMASQSETVAVLVEAFGPAPESASFDDIVDSRLGERPVSDVYGIGPKSAETLAEHGITKVQECAARALLCVHCDQAYHLRQPSWGSAMLVVIPPPPCTSPCSRLLTPAALLAPSQAWQLLGPLLYMPKEDVLDFLKNKETAGVAPGKVCVPESQRKCLSAHALHRSLAGADTSPCTLLQVRECALCLAMNFQKHNSD